MEARATAKHLRVSPSKLRRIVDVIRNRSVAEATAILDHLAGPSAAMVQKVLKSAVANAEFNYDMRPEECTVSGVFVNEGLTMKRWRFRARGMVYRIRKRTSHITIVVSDTLIGAGRAS